MSTSAFTPGTRVIAPGGLGVAEAQHRPGLSVLVRYDDCTRVYVPAHRVRLAPRDTPAAPVSESAAPRRHPGIRAFAAPYLDGEFDLDAVRAESDVRAVLSQRCGAA